MEYIISATRICISVAKDLNVRSALAYMPLSVLSTALSTLEDLRI